VATVTQRAIPAQGGGRLESIGKYTSGIETDEQSIDKFTLQAAARELTDSNALRSCLRVPIPNSQTVDVMKRKDSDRTYYRNLCTCKLVWLCPICASRISNKRTAELTAFLSQTRDTNTVDREGFAVTRRELIYHVAMITFTVGHKMSTPLARSMKVLKAAYHGIWSGRASKRFYDAYGLVGSVRAFEVTHGAVNGWHPHIHTLLISEKPFTLLAVSEMYAALATRWVDEVERAGGYATKERGVDIMRGEEALIKYVTKAGQKIAKTTIDKSPIMEVGLTPAKVAHLDGRTLWQLLADYVRGDVESGELWTTAQGQLIGTKQLLPSNSVKALLRDPDALDDNNAAMPDDNPEDVCLAKLSLDEWRLVHRWGLRGQLLQVARREGTVGVWDFMNRLRAMSRNTARIPS